MPIFGQRGLIAKDQLCNSLLHNWNSQIERLAGNEYLSRSRESAA
jgi:hypothetical protein